MSKLVEEMKLLITDEFRDTINDEINKLISFWEWGHVTEKVIEAKIKLPQIGDEDILNQMNMWSSLAKLAVNLYYDYDFFKQFKFKGQFDDQEYAEVLRTIGYVIEDDMWVNWSKPQLEDVHTVILTYCISLAIRNKRDQDDVIASILANEQRCCSCDRDSGVEVFPSINLPKEQSSIEIWTCLLCTFINRSERDFCQICYNAKESVDVPESKSFPEEMVEGHSTTWRCVHCSRSNLFDTYICVSCHKFAPFFRNWICEKCSLFNNELEEKCAACDNINRNLSNCSGCKKRMIKIGDSSLCSSCLAPPRRPSQYKPNYCAKCKGRLSLGLRGICDKCEKVTYYCNNQWCGAINKITSKHCQKCKLKKDSVVTEYNCVDVYNVLSYSKMWQCTFCHKFNSKTKCTECKNQQNSWQMKKCPWCNWVNAAILRNCEKCTQNLK